MHESIRKYSLNGVVKYDLFTQVRGTLEKAIEDRMRDEGYVPVLDLDPQLTQSMEDGNFNVTMSVYGAYVGEKSWQVAGLMNGKPIMKHTPKTKLNPSSKR